MRDRDARRAHIQSFPLRNSKSLHKSPGTRNMVVHTQLLGKFAFGDRTIPIHARTLGFVVTPHEMGMYYGTVQSAVLHTN